MKSLLRRKRRGIRPEEIKKYKDRYKDDREKAFTSEEINKLTSNSKNKEDIFYNMFCLILCTGLRSGEARALCWDDIDKENKTLSVNKTLAETGKGFVIQPPKSDAGKRIVPLNSIALNALERQMKWQERQKNAPDNIYMNNNLVFPDEKGYYVQGQRVLAHLNKLLKKSGIQTKHTIHDLRHTFCTLLRDNGINVENTMKLMGHSDIKTTLTIYSHPCNKEMIKATDCISESISAISNL